MNNSKNTELWDELTKQLLTERIELEEMEKECDVESTDDNAEKVVRIIFPVFSINQMIDFLILVFNLSNMC